MFSFLSSAMISKVMYPCKSYKVSTESLLIPRLLSRISLSSIRAPNDTTASPFPKIPKGFNALSP